MAEARAVASNKVPEIRKGDTVVLLRGKDAGKRGVVDRVLRNPVTTQKSRAGWKPATSRPLSVVVSGLNIAKRHTKPRMRSSQSDRVPQAQQGGIIDVPQPIAIGNVMVVCPHCEKPTRIGHAVLESGQRVRICHHCGEQLETRA